MELLIVILVLIIGLLTFLLLKKERVLGIKPETTNKNTEVKIVESKEYRNCLLYTSPSPRDKRQSRMPSSA